jgi:soluble lytic murein transglycosylase
VAALEALPKPLRDETRWRYWTARAAEAQGQREHALELYAAVVPTDNWYAVLAAARLGKPFAPHAEALAFDTARVAELGARPAFVRTRELLQVGLEPLAPAEWAYGQAALSAADQRQAIGLAAQWGWHFEVIASAAQQGLFNDYRLLYPRPYDSEVHAASELTGLSAALIYAVIRQESLYQPHAVSGANAIGLMQLLPTTARRTAVELGRSTPSRAALTHPSINVLLGAGTLMGLVTRFDGQLLPTLAGYNAGPRAARRWLPERPLEADAWVENIPFDETRNYVQRVMWHSVVFEWLAEGKPQDATTWLRDIQ